MRYSSLFSWLLVTLLFSVSLQATHHSAPFLGCPNFLAAHEQNQDQILRRIYRNAFEKLTEKNVRPEQATLINKILRNPNAIPDSGWLRKKTFAGSVKFEARMTAKFVEEFHWWLSNLRNLGQFSLDEIQQIDLVTFTRCILRDGQFAQPEIFNLSLLFDNIYGSMVYENRRDIQIVDWNAFMRMRRNLAVTQSAFIANIVNKEYWEKREVLLEDRLSEASQPLVLKPNLTVRFVKYTAMAASIVYPPMMLLIRDIFNMIEPTSPVDPIAGNLTKRFFEQQPMRMRLRKFVERLITFRRVINSGTASPVQLSTTVWELALEVCQDNREKAVILLGLLSIQRKAFIRNMAQHYEQAGVLHEYGKGLVDTVSVYYYITEIAEMIDAEKKRRGLLKEPYQFLYPRVHYQVQNNKFYHFWSEVALAYFLRKDKGYSKGWTRFGLRNVGRVYELATSFSGIQFFRAFGFSVWDSILNTKLSLDIRLHHMGVEFGLEQFEEVHGKKR